MKNARIAARLAGGFGVIILLLILLGAVARLKMGTLAGLTDKLYLHPFAVSVNLVSAEVDLLKMEKGFNEFLLAADAETFDRVIAATDEAEKRAQSHLDEVAQRYLGDPGDVAAIRQEIETWKGLLDQIIGLARAGSKEEAVELHRGKAARQFEKIDEKLGVIEEFAANKAVTFVDGAKATANSTFLLIYVLVALAVAGSAAIAAAISRSISRPLNQAIKIADKIAAGDLAISLPALDRRDEVGDLLAAFDRMIRYLQGIAEVAGRIATKDLTAHVQPLSTRDVLGNAFATMIDNLGRVLGEIQESANIVASSVGQILATTTQLAAGIAETATSVSETTATIEEVRQTAQLAAEKSRTVSDDAGEAAVVTSQGEAAVAETVEGIQIIKELMGTVAESVVMLSEQTQTIGEIINMVNDLAQQSNLLAVNAAIEASKAGEQGKGFAVVAQEIKSLADQSKQATEQVRTILADIQKATGKSVLAAEQVSKAVENGVKQAVESGESIRKLADSISGAAQAAAQIAASSQQQLVGMEQVAMAMESIKQATLQNTSGTRQAEQAAQTLNELGQKLKEMVGSYTVQGACKR